MGNNTEVVVVGGGYAGVMAANRLMQREDVTVTVLNPRPKFVERIRLHHLVAATGDPQRDFQDVLNERVRVVVDAATRIDAEACVVELESGETLSYDYLIYAVGSRSAEPEVPGAAEYAYPMATLDAAQRLRPVLDATPATAAVTVVGAGPAGIETAAELAEQGRRVTLVCGDELGPYLSVQGRRTVTKRFTALQVTVLAGPGATATSVTPETVHLADGRTVHSDVTVWTAGFGVPDLAARSGLSTDTAGRLRTDETLTSLDDERILAAGDCAAPSDLPFRMSCYVSGVMGAQAAETILSRIADTAPEAVHVRFNAMCISLGRGAGVFQIAGKDDVAKRFHIRGRLGAKLKGFTYTASIKHLVEEKHKPGSHTWVTDDKHRQQQLQAMGQVPAGAGHSA